MANVYFSARVNMEDEHGLKGSKQLEIAVDDTIQNTFALQQAAAQLLLVQWAEAFDNVIDAKITSVTMTSDLTAATVGLKASPGEQGIGEGANLVFTTEDLEAVEHERPYWLPSAKEGVFLSNFRTIDTGDTELLAWVALFNDVAEGVKITISDKEQVLSIVEGSYQTRKRDSNA